jgi:hypothetical protein
VRAAAVVRTRMWRWCESSAWGGEWVTGGEETAVFLHLRDKSETVGALGKRCELGVEDYGVSSRRIHVAGGEPV